MIALPPLLLLAAAPALADHPRTYLASIVAIPLARDEAIESFSFATWGVRFQAVCHIPFGWRIKAGGSANPQGALEGEGGQGITWFRRPSPPELRSLVLLTLYGPVQRSDIRSGNGIVPATFNGHATLFGTDRERKVRLTYRNVRLVPARRCPAS